jgi:Sulfatase
MTINEESVFFVTIDSCRYDTFELSNSPNMKSVGPLHKAQAPSHFTYGSHSAMFVGFTPGVSEYQSKFVNPKYARLFRLNRAGWSGYAKPGFELEGKDIIHGFRNAGYTTIGSAAMAWFSPNSEVSNTLTGGFDEFNYIGREGIEKQIQWILDFINNNQDRKLFVFLNIGETHVPYYYNGAPWDKNENTCVPFQNIDRSDECRIRQKMCCEYIDLKISPLLREFSKATILICGDHGDCWGEDGLWEHGISHPSTLTVPLIIRYKGNGIV